MALFMESNLKNELKLKTCLKKLEILDVPTHGKI